MRAQVDIRQRLQERDGVVLAQAGKVLLPFAFGIGEAAYRRSICRKNRQDFNCPLSLLLDFRPSQSRPLSLQRNQCSAFRDGGDSLKAGSSSRAPW